MHFIAQGAAQGVESTKAAIIVVAIAVVTFWRVVLRLVIALIAIAILVAVGSGVADLIHGSHP